MNGLLPRASARSFRPTAGARAVVRLGLVVLLAGAASGCMATRRDVPPPVPVDYRQRHPISVTEAERRVNLFIGSRRGALNGAQRGEVLAFAGAWRREGTGGIIIDVPAGTPNGRAATEAAREVRLLLSRAGVPARGIQLQSFAPDDPLELATVRLTYPKMTARAGPCGIWPDDLGPTFDREHLENYPYWNLGCSSQRNLAAMVAEPTDLVQPRADDPIYASRRTFVFERYRQGGATAGATSADNKGTVSDVGTNK